VVTKHKPKQEATKQHNRLNKPSSLQQKTTKKKHSKPARRRPAAAKQKQSTNH
jgi:hypothetical protein